ncbi:fasciclin domain-containing protein [Mumia zhuanghuii]|uniref:Fasciclin domain-containing protein n=1 Tax=Mumia zhuanghuii TaxID=2585211 RepID=A0A5C4MXL5_9ACTN|nr:fasciclin domain-containing protein [Mumia zhuanghuii]TNC46120.1 fasciclin domain-containing protein [Mumia zhuanghuii]TNC48855.1 fasciclin domain-containing protein [Mumia zhuanghuii]
MRTTTRKTRLAAVAMLASLALFTAGCGSDDSDSGSDDSTPSASESATSEMTDDAMSDASSELVGPGCAAYAEQVPSGPGSIDGMAQEPVATAASNNPLLKTLTAAVSGQLNPEVNLVDTLNGSEFTVFAPVDEAFAKLPKKTVTELSQPAGAEALTSVLTYHVVPGQLSPDEVVGTHKTVNGANLEVKGSIDALTVGADDAAVICGGVKTANATVYLIDSVLMPPM